MRSTRFAAVAIPVLLVPALLLSGCSSHQQSTGTTSSSAIPSSSAVSSSPASQSPTPTTTPTTSASTPKPTRTAAATPKPKPTPAPTKKPVAPRGPVVDPLTGGPFSTNPVIATKIDNTYFAVPQFGVSDADVVFVEQVEGGLTRLIAVFHTVLPTEVGPVRSVRSTDAQLLPAFGRPGLVFSGGAGGPLADLAKTSIVDTSGLSGAYFRSDAASGTYNLHADLTKIREQSSGLSPVRSVGFQFGAASAALTASRVVRNIRVVMEQGETDFTYGQGRYFRTRYGANVSDYQGKPEVADNVLVMNVTDVPDGTVDTNGQPSYLTRTVGSGKVTLFRDGHLITGIWKRAKVGGAFGFADANGKPLPFKRGKTWVMLAPQSAQVSAG